MLIQDFVKVFSLDNNFLSVKIQSCFYSYKGGLNYDIQYKYYYQNNRAYTEAG